MKKRLFISSILMTLVLLVAITTATFAWYQATAGASTVTPQRVNGLATVSADACEYTVGEYTLRFTIVENTDQSELVLSEWNATAVDANTGAYQMYIIDPAGNPIISTNANLTNVNSGVAVKVYKVVAQLFESDDEDANPVTLSGNDLLSFHADETSYSVYVTASAQDEATPTPLEHTTHIAGSSTNTFTEGSAAASHFTDAETTINFSVSPKTANSGNWDGSALVIGYVALSVDGGSHVSSSNKTVTTGDVTVTFTLSETDPE